MNGPDNHSGNSELARRLGKLEPGHLPTNIFEAIAGLVVTPTFVVIPLFSRGMNTRVFLTRRDDDDPHYPGLLHPPGKVMLSTDESLEAVFTRLMSSELNAVESVSPPVLIAPYFEKIKRGREIALVHYLEIEDPGEGIVTYDCSHLPPDVIVTDLPRIMHAVEAFGKSK